MCIHNISIIQSKRILRAAGVAAICVFNVSDGLAATKSWTNAGGDNAWTTSTNWNPGGAPGTGDLARIISGTGSTIFLRQTTGTVDAGTISFESGNYRNLFAGASSAGINFGSSAAVLANQGGMMGDVDLVSGVWVPKVTFALPSSGSLTVGAPAGSTLEMNARITGAASVTYLQISRRAEAIKI